MTQTDQPAYAIDASVAVQLFLQEPLSSVAASLFTKLEDLNVCFFVPDLFYIECGNIFWKYVMRSTISTSNARLYLEQLRAMDLDSVATSEIVDDALNIALANQISVYDACYVATARYTKSLLVTADMRLAQKMIQNKEKVLTLDHFSQS